MNVQDMKTRLLSLVETFKEKESELTDLDRAIGDGDHGVNMVRGFEALEQGLDDTDMKSLFKSTGMTLSLIHISEPTRRLSRSRMPSSA